MELLQEQDKPRTPFLWRKDRVTERKEERKKYVREKMRESLYERDEIKEVLLI